MISTKILATFAVAMMMFSGLVVLTDSEDSDATDGVLESLYAGSWTWDSTTGIGPFNSFYGAFDIDNGNSFVAILNPYDLSKKIDGTSLGAGNYNIMWVIPTVYWSVDANGDLTLTNDSTSGGTAYAHTIDGHVYNYLAIGVYHGSTATIGESTTVLTSRTGVAPTASTTITDFRTYAHNYTMDSSLGSDAYSMLWNFYQWELYKYCGYAVMEDFDSQAVVGNGNVYGSDYTKLTGGCDTMGPYAGNNGDMGADGSAAATFGLDYAKLFIEESWGTVYDYIDGVLRAGNQFYIDSSSTPSGNTSGTYVVSVNSQIPSKGYATAIATSDARIWGSATASVDDSSNYDKGTADAVWGGTNLPFVVQAGGHAVTSNSSYYGISFSYSYAQASSSSSSCGARLSFVMDALPVSNLSNYSYTLDYTASDMATTSKAISVAGMDPISHTWPTYTATIQSSNTSYGTVDESSIADIEPGTTITISGSTLTINTATPTVVTATPVVDSTGQYVNSFVGWYDGSTQLQTSDTIDTNMTITASFSQALATYTVTIVSNNTSYGTVSTPSLQNIEYGTTVTVNNNDTLSIGSNTVTVTPGQSTAQYSYILTGWQKNGTAISGSTTITGADTITAIFEPTVNTYTVSAAVDGTNSYGSLNKSSVASVPYGTTVTISGQTATVNLSPTADTITATETTDTVQYDYGWIGWTYQGSSAPASITVTGNVEITANFSRATQEYTVNYVSNNDNYGTISPASATTVPYGSAFVIDGRDITVDSQTSTATPHASTPSNSYSFTGYSVSNNAALNETTFPSLAIGQSVTVTGTFTEGPRVYTVTIVKNDNAWGTVSQSEIAVGYETTISANANVLTVGTTDITATETTDTDQYDYSFVDWTGVPSSGKVTDDITVTANFSQVVKQYTITWSIDGTDDTTQVAYGTVPTHADPVKANYTFTGWNPTPVAVTGTATYTAQFTPTVYTVTWNANGGTVDTATSTGSVESAVTVPTPTLDYNTFAGWYTEATGGTAITTPYYPTADITLYAHWMGIEYTVTFDATTNGGTTATASLTGTNSAGVTLPTATKENMSFAGWYTEATGGTRVGFANDIYHPTADITLYAQYIEEDITTYSVNFNLDGGYGSITSLTYTGNVAEPHTFTIPDVSPSKYLLTFLGWATEIGQTSAQYVAGDTITVDPNASVTLYAVWGDTDDHDSFKSILNTIPLLMVIGLLLGVVGVFFNARKNGIDPKTVISVCIGAAIGIVVIAVLIAPLFASL